MAKKQKTATAGGSAQVIEMVTPERKAKEMAGLLADHTAWQKDVETARRSGGVYRNRVKSLIKLGIQREAIAFFVANKDRPIRDIQAELKATFDLHELMGRPIGTQFDLLADAADSTEDDASLRTAEQLGDTAAAEAWGIERNPYDIAEQEGEHKAWIAAYESRQATIWRAANGQAEAAE